MSPVPDKSATAYPCVHLVGEDGLLVEFSAGLDMAANQAALAFRAAVARLGWSGLRETSTSLKSVFVRFDPAVLPHADVRSRIDALIAERDWLTAALPEDRSLWRIPAVFGGAHGPQLAEVADLTGLDEPGVVAEIADTRLRVLTVGFAPGQPYLGQLGARFDFPRQKSLTERVPKGAVVTAIRQIVLFSNAAPTGWRQVGLSAFECFRPNAEAPFALAAGDEVVFEPVTAAELSRLAERAEDGALAALREDIR